MQRTGKYYKKLGLPSGPTLPETKHVEDGDMYYSVTTKLPYIRRNSQWTPFNISASGVSNFLQLTDTPATYSGAHGQFVTVSGTVLEFGPVPNWTNTLIVDPNGKGNYTTINAALTAASPGDTILVTPGTYAEAITINKTISIKGITAGYSSAAGGVIITGDGSTTTLEVASGSVRLEALRITNEQSNVVSVWAGNVSGGDLTAWNCTFYANNTGSGSSVGFGGEGGSAWLWSCYLGAIVNSASAYANWIDGASVKLIGCYTDGENYDLAQDSSGILTVIFTRYSNSKIYGTITHDDSTSTVMSLAAGLGNALFVGEDSEYTTIGAAITAASAGDTIFVAPGTYNEALTISKNLDIVGLSAGYGGGSSTGVYINASTVGNNAISSSGTVVRLQNLYVSNSRSIAGTVIALNITGGQVVAWNCQFYADNTSSGFARGIYLSGGSSTLWSCYPRATHNTGNSYALQNNGGSAVYLIGCWTDGETYDLVQSSGSVNVMTTRYRDGKTSGTITQTAGYQAHMAVLADTTSPTPASEVVQTNSGGDIVLDADGDLIQEDTGTSRGIFTRYVNRQAIDDHFTSGSIPTNYSWISDTDFSGTPSLLDYDFGGSYMQVAGASTNRYFLADTGISTWYTRHITIRTKISHSALVGVRLDDGTDDNCVEQVLFSNANTGYCTVRFRYKLDGASSYTNVDRITDLPTSEMFTIRLYAYTAAMPTSWTAYAYWIDETPASCIIHAVNMGTWTVSRVGIILDASVGGTAYTYTDWMYSTFS